MKKLADKEAIEYWVDTHRFSKHDLQAVCFPNRSVWFNLFFDRIEKFAITRSLRYLNISIVDNNVLDVGCGRGRWLEFYSARGANATGIDISMDAVDSCRQKGFIALNGSIECLPFADNAFDMVNSVTVLQHLPYEKQKKAVGEMLRVVRDGGHVTLLENTWDDPSPHVWGRSVEDWRSLLNNCELIFSENHYYIYLLRALWRAPFVNSIQSIRWLLENSLIAISYPLEFGLMKMNFAKLNKGGLQHLMIFQKAEGCENER